MTPQLTVVEEVLNRYPSDAASLIMVLQDVQAALNHVPDEAVDLVSDRLGVPRTKVHSAVSFYKAFSVEPRGKHRIDVCMGTACHVRGAERLVNQLADELDVAPGDTTTDGEVTLDTVHCVGACALGPVVVLDGACHGEMKPRKLSRAVKACCESEPAAAIAATPGATLDIEAVADPAALQSWRDRLHAAADTDTAVISLCAGSGCRALGADAMIAAFETVIAERGLAGKVRIQKNGCHGFCERGLICIVRPKGVLYQKIKPTDAAEIIEQTIEHDGVVERLLFEDPATGAKLANEQDIPFYARQTRSLMKQNALIDPLSIDDYVAAGGYGALARALTGMTPEQVIDEVKASGLRGRGGGGFHAARKWASARKVAAERKFILCNADEGDPGAFMDCSLLEGNPHSVIEGMIIGAYAVAGGQSRAEGYVYVRAEYPVAVEHLNAALDQARAAGLLGDDILGSGFAYDIKVSRGGGSFVCGESTALMKSIEGEIGEPRAKYVHTSTSGLYDSPTVLNNVETWANVPLIVNEGADAFTSIGTERSKGTKIFSLVGKVVNTGLVEVPMGMTLREIVYDIGGGIRDGKTFKAVQTGGPSGGCVPASLLDIPVDFDELSKAGSMMGSGGMIVMDEHTCMVDVARYFTEFLSHESCGKCAACRLGLDQMLAILQRICAGEGAPDDLPTLEKLFAVLDDGSLCGLGKSAANPVRSTLAHFRDEYEAHINDKRCPAGVCRELIIFEVTDACNGCGACAKVCPADAVVGEKNSRHSINIDVCTSCGLCQASCPEDAILSR
jgi:NADH:ubiquinone oxidoreductase subunit F (NADH-binding)/NADH:ubiquinone oxidoreductase subunit E/NAD-dependent dihydropyrimidine dehydrogenase PreA subunit